MLAPKKIKWRKQQRGKMRGVAKGGASVQFGEFGLQALTCGYVTSRQIEAARVAITRKIKRGGKLYIRIFPDKPITKKPAEVRMGKGKGAPEGFVAPVTPGRILMEIEGVPFEVAKEALRLGSQKFPVPCKFVVRHNYEEQQL